MDVKVDWDFAAWDSGLPYEWMGCGQEEIDFTDWHVDLGCGTIKKGKIGIDRFPAPGVNIVMDLETMQIHQMPSAPNRDADISHDAFLAYGQAYASWKPGLPFPDNSIESIVSHHFLEHIGPGFVFLVDEIYRVLKPEGLFRAITPLFPSRTAVEDPDHRRYFMENSWLPFQGWPDNHWMSSFSVPYSRARFSEVEKSFTPALPVEQWWGPDDAREIRITLSANK